LVSTRRCAIRWTRCRRAIFALEFLAAASIAAVHISRALPRRSLLWGLSGLRPSFGFSDAFLDRLLDHAAESAIPMPLSLPAPRSDASWGRSLGLLTVVKGLPLAYAKDLQEDKEAGVRRVRCARSCACRHGGHVR